MKLVEKILLGIDFSEASERALVAGAGLAKAFGAKAILIHVISETTHPDVSLDTVKAEAQKGLKELQQKLGDLGVKETDSVVTTGLAFDRILQCADLHDVNLIVLGTRNDAEANKGSLGITDERLICRADKPVLIAQQQEIPKNILCAVDFSEPSGRALKDAAHLARKLNAGLTVLTVAPSLSSLYKGVLARRMTGATSAKESYLKEHSTNLDSFLADFDLHGIALEKVIKEGKPDEQIISLVQEKPFDLLVMGSVGKTGLSRIVLGSVAEKVLQAMPCSILTVKSEDAIRLRIQETITDIQESFKKAQELLENGFTQEAIERFKHCIDQDLMFAPAYEGLGAAYERQGNSKRAETYQKEAKAIRQQLWELRVKAEIVGQHAVMGKKG